MVYDVAVEGEKLKAMLATSLHQFHFLRLLETSIKPVIRERTNGLSPGFLLSSIYNSSAFSLQSIDSH